ncbi:hypothetical protein J0X19_10060 [Hymenobacter sp. BT186]|uniref:Uncharacterized protein n=1 Tax=Hymenobacter telluris TaxID=2816474 RepID=A0A939JDF0_9BACT|nr:hypothetical protein [Hymenobacter telluris]MBO0358287.1 hypothetical protein [Hymenobacter telluris]MBW3374313.1 hypothetical protein [Hymenobacter norwichensis]
MSIRYRVLCLLMVLGLAGSPGITRAQTAPVATSQDDNLKGQIWTVTARRIWVDVKPKQPQALQPWATGTDFTNWVLAQKQDKSELGILRGAVIERIGKGQTGSAAQVAQAIVDEVAQRREKKVGALARVDVVALNTELTPFIQLATPADTAAVPDESLAPATNATAQIEQPAQTDYQDTIPETTSGPEPMVAPVQVAPTYWGMSPAVAGTLLALLGALVGAGLTYNRMESARRKRRRHSSSHMVATPAVEPETQSVMNTPQYRKLLRQNQDLQKQLDQLKKELTDLKARVTGVPAAPLKAAPPRRTASTPPPPPPVQAPADDHDDLLNVGLGTIASPEPAYEQPSAQLPPATRYGPVQETPFVEERKIVDNPLPQLALMLTINPRNPDQASFTLNPHVNQSMLIGDGLNRLQKFFEYDPPVGRINSVAAAAAGTLQRQADGWQVVERARLIIR